MTEELRIPPETLTQQFASSDPCSSAWVAANAGSGKTHVLTQRVIRLLLEGNNPDRILCLTFTKAAAANMKTRVFDTLADWAMMPDAKLDEAIEKLCGESPATGMRLRARQLFAAALDTPGGLKIQTIHAFCESLLHQFPLEANVPGNFETLQEAGQAQLLSLARAEVLSGESGTPELSQHYAELARTVGADTIEKGITAIIARRSEFLNWIEPDGLDAAMLRLHAELEAVPGESEADLASRSLSTLPFDIAGLQKMSGIASQSDKSRDLQQHERLQNFLKSKDPMERFSSITDAALTAAGIPRGVGSIATNFVSKQMPECFDLIGDCGLLVLEIRDRLNTRTLLEHSTRLFKLGLGVIEQYEAKKRARGMIDYNDQINKCATLLNRSEIRDWIRYRLDRGIDHMLVDEAQDTSPQQWEIINAITADFHVGETAAVRNRTMFVVGDEKQSIYSFQGAQPQEFARQQKTLSTVVSEAQKSFHNGKLTLSFRSTRDILHAVDEVFAVNDNRRGLTQSGEQPVHDAIRETETGEVQVWPLFMAESDAEETDWLAPIDYKGRADPAIQLAEKITQSIGQWVGKPLPGSPKPLQFGEILVLVRKRDRFITALTRTMKDAGLQVAGADRIVLTEHIAVEDLLALGQFALLPQDDLNLACVLKGVLFNLDEETLFDFAYGRRGSLYDALHLAARETSAKRHSEAAAILPVLEKIQSRAARLGVFEFFAWLLGPLGARKAFLSRLGQEAEDVLDAFLEETLTFEQEGGMGLQNFVVSLIQAQPEIKREVEIGRNEVRILTTHSAKGLEARLVFLVDPCNAPWTEHHRPPILEIGSEGNKGFLWLPRSDLHTSKTRQRIEDIARAAEEEYRRLLYVGMTRAADRLVMCGYRGKKEIAFRHWHLMVSEALETDGTWIFDDAGNRDHLVWRSPKSPEASHQLPAGYEQSGKAKAATQIPDWLTKPAPAEPATPSPLSPAGAYALINEELANLSAGEAFSSTMSGFAIERGLAMHKLLETLPDIEESARRGAAERYLAQVGAAWHEHQREGVLSDLMGVLDDPQIANLLKQPSRAEVSVVGRLETNSGNRMISGQIDRLVVGSERVVVLDFKTGMKPETVQETADSYVVQLALYREMVRQIYPNHTVECALVWTREPLLQPIPDDMLTEAIVRIRQI